jgi:uncharacterized membrane protein SpoIIM required for sporulation
MKVAHHLAERQAQWTELEQLCAKLEQSRRGLATGQQSVRFASLYRSACADLALAEANQLPPGTTQYLHHLVGRAHNQLYRSRSFNLRSWSHILLHEVPRQVFQDGCVQLAFALFWGIFLISAALAASPAAWPEYAERMLGPDQMEQLENSFDEPIGRGSSMNPLMASFYIWHNTGIGLKCFVGGLLFLPGLITTAFNAVELGAAFGYMARPDNPAGKNFFEFVTAHGPFELTAIVLSAGSGLRLGLAWLKTNGLTRTASLRLATRQAMPIMGAAMLLFFLAALIEGFLSPTPAPYWIKALVAIASSGFLMFYFVVLGFPEESSRAA